MHDAVCVQLVTAHVVLAWLFYVLSQSSEFQFNSRSESLILCCICKLMLIIVVYSL